MTAGEPKGTQRKLFDVRLTLEFPPHHTKQVNPIMPRGHVLGARGFADLMVRCWVGAQTHDVNTSSSPGSDLAWNDTFSDVPLDNACQTRVEAILLVPNGQGGYTETGTWVGVDISVVQPGMGVGDPCD